MEKTKVTIELPNDMIKWMEKNAQREECSFDEMVRRALHKYQKDSKAQQRSKKLADDEDYTMMY